ncbi:TetR/AcrR family transcriptional regulator [Nocardioides caeni]|uniref:TetR/AcrR family transcriptional regulator n=1 Tax=Nocardioides caeni TaxID=574700 RepID=UPI00130509D7|nr:TetR/AcrR family transcriptional regulator [Nocardioides caeni]
MSSSAEEAWRGTTADERARQRRDQLLAAGLGILGDGGAQALTVRAVTRAAGLSPRFFYESFADRDALAIAVWDEQYAEVAELVEGAIAEAAEDFASRIRAALLVVARWLEERPARGRVMLNETLADPLLRRHARRRLPELVLGTMVASVDPVAAAALRPEEIQLTVTALSGAIVNLFLEWNAGAIDVSADYLVEAVVEVATAGLERLLRT